MPRSIAQDQEEINSINLHAFGEASSQGLSTAVYAVRHQSSGISQVLVAAKSRMGKKGLAIPRLQLVAGKMVGLTMTKIREKYCIPRLRRLTKQVIENCEVCKRFEVAEIKNPPTVNLERTEGSVPFEFIGMRPRRK